MDARTETRTRNQVAGPVSSVKRRKGWVTFTVTVNGWDETFRIAREEADACGLKYPVRALVLFESNTGSVVKVISSPTTSQILQGVEWAHGGGLPK